MYNYNYFTNDFYSPNINTNLYREAMPMAIDSLEYYEEIPNIAKNNANTTKNITNSTNQELVNPTTAYENGNLFQNLYEAYKNYEPAKLSTSSEKEQLLLELAKYAFAAHDVNLYLDINPNDTSMITLFNDYKNKADTLAKDYENKYGPLNINSSNMDKTPFNWVSENWPWEEDYHV